MDASLETSATLLNRQLSHAFAASRWQVVDLSDDEYFWEPAEGCWSVRGRDAARSAGPSGAGDWVIDGEWPLSRPPPFTTIAWRLVHLVGWTGVYRDWTFGSATRSFDDIVVPGSAAEAVQMLHGVQDHYAASVAQLDDRDVHDLRPTHWGPEFPIGVLVWQIAVEHLHHSAEIGVLRDLRRGHARGGWWPEPVLG